MATVPPNSAIADALEELGDLYELDGAIVHRVVAYRTAARSVREAGVSVAELALQGRATELAGVGDTLQEKILALVETGAIGAMEKLRAKFPPGLVAMTRLPGVGPKRVRMLHSELGVDSLESLREAALAGRLRTVRGLGEKFEASVLKALERGVAERRTPRLLLPRALELGEALARELTDRGGEGTRVMIAGSARRMADSVKDVDLVAVTRKPVTLAKSLAALPEIESVSSAGKAGAKGRSHSGASVDLRIAKPSQLGNLLQHFTGSGKHNAALREAAVRKGLHVSEYGVYEEESATTTTCESEREVYGMLGLAYIEPELRENRGELAAAALDFQRTTASGTGPHGGAGKGSATGPSDAGKGSATGPSDAGKGSATGPSDAGMGSATGPSDAGMGSGNGLPTLIELEDIKGDLHCHTVASDGRDTIEAMALGARERGYEYVAITDHSASHGFGDDVSPEQLRRQIELVREADASIEGIRILAGSEVNILPDGSLDYEDDLLGELDWVIASVHTAFGMSEQAMTERMISAVEHPLVDAIGHPTGRLIERREPYALDMHALIEAAARTGTMLEINANPDRRDLNEVHARAASQAGATILIDSDAHWVARFDVMRWGIATARRAWLEAADVANTRPWEELAKLRKPGRRG